MEQVERIRLLIQTAIRAIDDRLGIEDIPEGGPLSETQLHDFRQILVQMASKLGFWRIFKEKRGRPQEWVESLSDSWPLDSEIGEAILAAEQEDLEIRSDRQ